MQTTSELLMSSVRHFPDKVFVHEGIRSMTYLEFHQSACRLANVLADHGVTKGTPVGLYLPSCLELALGYHAAQKLGAIAVPMSAMYQRREIEDIGGRTEMPVIVTDGDGVKNALAAAEALASLQSVLQHGDVQDGAVGLDALLASASMERELTPCDPEDVAALFFTSGTTGTPKGAMQSHRSIYHTLRDMEVYNRFRFGQEVLLDPLPIFNNFGATCLMMGAIYNGGTLVMHQRWNTEQVLKDIEKYGATYVAGTPTMYVHLWKAYDASVHNIASLKLAVAGGAPVAPEVLESCERELGLTITQIYGATESSGYVTGDPVVGVRKRGSAGPAFGSSSIAIMDDDGNALSAGEIGEVVIGGDCVGVGYWRDETATTSSFTSYGWRSGDLGYCDEDGYVFIVDRKKDVIISGGYNVYPVEVEDVLYRHPKVQMCAVVGKPDEVKGELAVAVVVPAVEPSDELAEELRVYCRQEMAAYKAPRAFRFVEEMPLGPSGKILKRELRDQLQQEQSDVQ